MAFPGRAGAESDEGEPGFGRPRRALLLRPGGDGVPVAEGWRKAGISRATCFAWRRTFAGLLPTEVTRPKQLEDESGRPRTLVADLSLDREMPRGTSSTEGSEACPDARAGGRDLPGVGGVGPQGLWSPRGGSAALPVPSPRAGPTGDPERRSARRGCGSRLAPRPCAASPGGLDDQPREDAPRLQRAGPAAARQRGVSRQRPKATPSAGTAREGEAPGGPTRGCGGRRDLGDGPRPRPARHRPQAQGAGHRRHVPALLARLVRHRSEGRGERLHRGARRPVPGRVPERPPGPGPGRCPGNAGGLAQGPQRGPTPRRDRPRRPDRAREPRRRHRPAADPRPGNSSSGWPRECAGLTRERTPAIPGGDQGLRSEPSAPAGQAHRSPRPRSVERGSALSRRDSPASRILR